VSHSPDVPERLALPQVTLCAATSVNVRATVRALEACLAQSDFAACKLFTDASILPENPAIEVIPIAPLTSLAAYSHFLLSDLVDHVETSHCLIAQWDGHIVDARRWRADFLDHDYIGARWPQFDDGHDVGNGGFSLRSRRLMKACRAPEFCAGEVEDIAIGRTNRAWLESLGMRFASSALAELFSSERSGDPARSFGYHGVFNMPRAVGIDAFWQIYLELDDRGTLHHDFFPLLRQVGRGRHGFARMRRMISDRLRAAARSSPRSSLSR